MIGIDHEYIPENAAQGDVPGGRPDVQWTYCEVMQVGACKLDATGKELGVLNLTVRAHRITTIPPWLSKMTGMTEERRSTGITFLEGLERLKEFIGDDQNLWTMSGDWWVLQGNAKEHRILLPFKHQFKKLKPKLPELGITLEHFQRAGYNEVISGGLYKVLGIDMPMIEGVEAHDAAHDARSLAYAVHHLGLTNLS